MEYSFIQVNDRFLHMIGFILSLTILIGSSCKKKTDDPIPSDEKKLEVLWQYSYSDSDDGLSITPYLYQNMLLTSFRVSGSTNNEVLYALDAETGELIWEWEDYVRPAPQKFRGKHRNFIREGSFFLGSSQDVYEIDIESGLTQWSSNIEEANPRISQGDEHMYSTMTYGSAPLGDSSIVIERAYDDPEWTKVFSIHKQDDFEANLETASEYIDTNGDRLLFFQDRTLKLMPFTEKVDLYCYNASADSILWVKTEFTPSGSSNTQPPLIEGDRLYFGGKWDMICLELPSGNELWRNTLYWDFQGSNFLLYEDLIITNLDNGDLIALNKNSGNIVWQNEDLSGCCVELRIYEDRIYFGNNDLFVLDAITGSLLCQLEPTDLNGNFKSGVAVDLLNKRMYCSDGYSLLCMKLPE